MNFQNLRYFLSIKDAGNITKAAEKLHVSQQSLSEQLKKLENELGVVLVKRGSPLVLTDAGKIFSNAAEEIIGTYDNMLDSLATISSEECRKIRLAIPTTEMPPFLPGLLMEFSKNYPEYEVSISRVQPIDAASQAKTFDLYFSTLPLSSELVNELLLETGTYAVAIASDLAKRIYGNQWPDIERQLIQTRKLGTLREMPFIILYNRSNEMVLDQNLIFRDAGFSPKITFHSDNSELNSQMCTLGIGAYVATMEYCKLQFHDYLNMENGIKLYPLDTVINPVAVALSYRKGSHLSKASTCFIKFARQYLKDSM